MSAVVNPLSHRSRLLNGAAGLFGALVLYVLSIGPAACLATRSDALIPPLEKFYRPLLVAANWSSLDRLLERYVNWWEALGPN